MITLLFDDGAGLVKAGLLGDDGKLITSIAFPALVGAAPHQLDREFYDDPDVKVVQNGEGVSFLVGSVALKQSRSVVYDTSDYRYTSPDSLLRLYAALGTVLPPDQAHSTIRAVVGTNVGARKSLHDDVMAHLNKPHRFRYNGHPYDLTIRDILVTSQPRGALEYVMRHPPAALQARLARLPLARATAVIVDVGTFTTDIMVLKNLTEIYERQLALRFGVDTLREEIGVMIKTLRKSTTISLSDMDDPLASGQTVINGEVCDISADIAQTAKRLWDRAYWTHLKPHLEGIEAHYVFVLGGGATDAVYGKPIAETWGTLPFFGRLDDPIQAVMLGYGELARQKWGKR